MMPIIIGVVAAVLIGGGGVAFLFMRTAPETATAPSSSANGEPAAPASSNGEPAPAPTPASNSSPDPVAPSPAPEKSAEAEDAGAPESADKVSVTFKCDPQCDRIEIDGKPVEKPYEPQQLAPGKHKIRLIKTGYVIHPEEIDVAAGAPVEKTVKLVKIIVPPPNNKCGQFLCP